MFHLQLDVAGPLLLNASLLLVLTTDYSDWLVQVDVVGPLLLNASLLLVLTTDYSDWLVQVTQLIVWLVKPQQINLVSDFTSLSAVLLSLLWIYLISEIKFYKEMNNCCVIFLLVS